jgi:hypothetical protein
MGFGRVKFLAALIMSLLVTGCIRSSQQVIVDCIARSSLIYLAERRGDDYYVLAIVRDLKKAPLSLVQGEKVALNFQLSRTFAVDSPKLIVVLVERVERKADGNINAGQSEFPLSGDMILSGTKLNYIEFLHLVEKNTNNR